MKGWDKAVRRLTVISSESADFRVIHDLLRIYFPRLKYEEADGSAYFALPAENMQGPEQLSAQAKLPAADILPANVSADDWPQLLARIEKKATPAEITVTFQSGDKFLDKQCERLRSEVFTEDRSNRERRLLRLAFHRVLVRVLSLEPSPWGILTGVRPTKIVHRFLDEGFSGERIKKHLTSDFALSEERAELLTKVAEYQRPFFPRAGEEPLLGLYVGIPFCPTRCRYCSFPSFSLARWGHLLPAYLAGLERELTTVGNILRDTGVKVQTVYLGGGTPTVLSEAQLARLLETVEDSFSFTEDRELTVEGGRPDTIDSGKLHVLKEHRVTRLSINPQTMRKDTLLSIGRQHTVQEVYQAYELAREAGIPVVNMDLIIGLPGEDCTVLAETLRQVLQMAPENITLHALAMKRAAYYRQENIAVPVSQEGLLMMNLAHGFLQAAGYIPYYLYRQKEIFAHGENVGYTIPGKACLYNIQMMEERQTILGFGVGSGSKLVRQADLSLENIYNPKDVLMYLERSEEIIRKKVDNLQRILYNN